MRRLFFCLVVVLAVWSVLFACLFILGAFHFYESAISRLSLSLLGASFCSLPMYTHGLVACPKSFFDIRPLRVSTTGTAWAFDETRRPWLRKVRHLWLRAQTLYVRLFVYGKLAGLLPAGFRTHARKREPLAGARDGDGAGDFGNCGAFMVAIFWTTACGPSLTMYRPRWS